MVSNPHHDKPEIGIEVAELLVRLNLCSSKTKARKAIQEGAVRISNEKVTDPFARVFLFDGRYILMEGGNE